MAKTNTLTIFIDGLPFDQLHKMSSASLFESKARLIPILGYSVNCQTQLFTGKGPDELGFWCEFTHDPKGSPYRKWKPILRLMSLCQLWYPLERIGHRILDRVAASTKNIPFRYLSEFSETGHTVFSEEFDGDSLLLKPGVTSFLYRDYPGASVDSVVFKATKKYIQETDETGHVIVTLVEIDSCSHWSGVDSEPYNEMFAENDRYIHELYDAFKEKNPDGKVFLVSDHGMVNVTRGVKLELESSIGDPIRTGYAYFSEGTILRVWTEKEDLLEEIRMYLDGIQGMERLPDWERAEHGITSPAFGDLIYHTLEGHQFVPSYWGRKPSKGMHGYHPRYRSQHGVCMSTVAGDFEGSVSAVDFYSVLSRDLEA